MYSQRSYQQLLVGTALVCTVIILGAAVICIPILLASLTNISGAVLALDSVSIDVPLLGLLIVALTYMDEHST